MNIITQGKACMQYLAKCSSLQSVLNTTNRGPFGPLPAAISISFSRATSNRLQ